jgi:hypothetical protein
VHTALSAEYFYYIQLLAMAKRTNLEAVANGVMNFLNTDLVFSVAKGAMMLSAIGKCAMMPERRL